MSKGNCQAKLRRFYFDTKEGICKLFIFGGCQGKYLYYLHNSQCSKIRKKVQKNREITFHKKKSTKNCNLTRQYTVCLKGSNQHFLKKKFEQSDPEEASSDKIFKKTLIFSL